MAKKLDIAALPVGVHRVETSLYIRKRTPPRGATWIYVFYLRGRRREFSLGSCETVTQTAARQRAVRLKALVDQGIDPVEERRRERAKEAAAAAEGFTFARLVEESLTTIAATKRWRNPKSGAQWRASIETYATPMIGEKKVFDITREDILDVLKPIWETKTETASRLRGRLEAIFSYAIATGRYSGMNPALWRGNLDLFLAPRGRVAPVKHQTALTVAETRALLADVSFKDIPISWAAIVFCILTAARVNEAVGAKWSEIDLKKAVWSCPRRKDGRSYPHRVPLSQQALLLLRSIPRKSEYLFPAPKDASKPISLWTPRMLVLKKIGKGTMHGFRSTFRDWAAETGQDRVLAEKSLMHATGNEVEQAYQRSDLLEQRRPLMQKWADAVIPMNVSDDLLP